MKTRTLDISKVTCPKCQTKDVVTEVDYDSSGITEIRVWSEQFQAFVPVSMSWLSNNFPGRLMIIKQKVEQALEVPEVREYNPEEEIA